MSRWLFLGVCLILDLLLLRFLPYDSSSREITIVPLMTLIACLCLCLNSSWYESFGLSIIVGCILDFISFDLLGSYTISLILSVIVMRRWHIHLNETIFERVLLFGSTIFVNQVLIYLVMLMFRGFSLSIEKFLFQRCIPTMMASILMILVVLWLYGIKNNYDDTKEQNKKKEGSILWQNYK